MLQFPLTAIAFVGLAYIPALQAKLPKPNTFAPMHTRLNRPTVSFRRELRHPAPVPADPQPDMDSEDDVPLDQPPAPAPAPSTYEHAAQQTPPSARPPAPMSELDRFLAAHNVSQQQVRETSARKTRPAAAARRAQPSPGRSVAFTPDTRDRPQRRAPPSSAGGGSLFRGPSLPGTPWADSSMQDTLDASFAESTGGQRSVSYPDTPAPQAGEHTFGAASSIWADDHTFGTPAQSVLSGYLPSSAGGSTARRSGRRRRR